MYSSIGEIKYEFFLFELWFLIVHNICIICLFESFHINMLIHIFFTSFMLMSNHIKYIFLVFHKLINFEI